MLIESPRHGWWVTAPSNSPENAFLLPDGTKCACLPRAHRRHAVATLPVSTPSIEASEQLGPRSRPAPGVDPKARPPRPDPHRRRRPNHGVARSRARGGSPAPSHRPPLGTLSGPRNRAGYDARPRGRRREDPAGSRRRRYRLEPCLQTGALGPVGSRGSCVQLAWCRT
jgi:hypothetical protein